MSASAAIVCCQWRATIVAFRQQFHSLSSCAAGAAECRMQHFERQMHGWSLRAPEVFVYMEAGRRFAEGQPYGRQVHTCLSVTQLLCCVHHASCITSKLVRDATCTEAVRWLIPGGDGR